MNTNNNKQNTAAVGLSKLIKPALNFAVKVILNTNVVNLVGIFHWDTVLIRKGVLKKYSVKKQIHWT